MVLTTEDTEKHRGETNKSSVTCCLLCGKKFYNFLYNKKGRSKQSGFTLIELVVVLVILGFVGALITPAIFQSLANLRLRTAAKQLAATLRYARSQAVSSKSTQTVTLDLVQNAYQYALPQAVTEGGLSVENEERTSIGSLPQGVVIKEAQLGDEWAAETLVNYQFYPKGNALKGEIVLENEHQRQYVIQIEPITGRVKVNLVGEVR